MVNTNTLASWKELVYHVGSPALSASTLKELRDNQRPAIILKGLLNTPALAAFQEAVDKYRDHAIVSKYPNGSLTTIGPYIVRHLKNPEEYFANARATDVLFQDPDRDLRTHVIQQLRQIFGLKTLETATQNGRSYAPMIVRLHSNGINNPLHNDHIMRDAAGTDLVLAKLDCQFSCIVCVQECDEGGELVLYRKPWEPEDEQYKIPGGLGYNYGVVEKAECFKYKPATGDVYLINPTNYHEIYEVRGTERRTLSFFFGFFDKELEQGVIWS